ncbi:MAG: nicotinate-nucleotide adenylyltransferase [Crinalium sp.]
MKIALFGTSADPPTTGHQTIISGLSQCYDLVAVWASDNPFKQHQAPLQHRAVMLQLLINDAEERNNIILAQELSSTRTIETVEKARQRWYDAEFTVVIGSDLVQQLGSWYRASDLLQQVKILIVPRPGYAVDEAGLERLRQLEASFAIAQLNPPEISSTVYREIKDPQALTPTVEAYIHQQHLYECHPSAQKKLQIR